jgi:hypothetical protein
VISQVIGFGWLRFDSGGGLMLQHLPLDHFGNLSLESKVHGYTLV